MNGNAIKSREKWSTDCTVYKLEYPTHLKYEQNECEPVDLFHCTERQTRSPNSKNNLQSTIEERLHLPSQSNQKQESMERLKNMQINNVTTKEEVISTEELVTHRYTHTSDARFACCICRNRFQLIEELHLHIDTAHCVNLSW